MVFSAGREEGEFRREKTSFATSEAAPLQRSTEWKWFTIRFTRSVADR